jgi:hypothetical protein
MALTLQRLRLAVLAIAVLLILDIGAVEAAAFGPDAETMDFSVLDFYLPNDTEGVTSSVRNRREGFGPWQSNDAWNEKGQSNLAPSAQAVEKAVAETYSALYVETFSLVRDVRSAFEAVESALKDPFGNLMKTWIGIIFLTASIICISILFFRLVAPTVRAAWAFDCWIARLQFRFWRWVLTPVYKFALGSFACMYLCALAPCVKVRNWQVSRRLAKQDRERVKVYSALDQEEMIEVLRRTTSQIGTDEHGVYLEAGPNHRVYLDPATRSSDLQLLKSFSKVKREPTSVNTIKETIMPASKLYKLEKLPSFQGQFDVDGTVIGHFSRIKFQGRDCLLTAFHVLDYNRSALIRLKHQENLVRLDSIRSRVVCASPSSEYDFIIMEIPSFVFSSLGMKIGTWCSRVQSREPISICQLYEGKPCVASASIRISDTKPWHINYGASTTPGTSGAPILDSRNQIVGVHVEYDVQAHSNVGVIPPVFRSCKKESPTSEDIGNGQPEINYEEPDEAESDNELEEYENAQRIFFREKLDVDIRIYEMDITWAEQLDLIDHRTKKSVDEFKVFRTKNSDTQGKHVNQMIKRGRVRKESPWTCSKCFTIHEKRNYNCAKCGYVLVPLTAKHIKSMADGGEEAITLLRNYFPEEIVNKIMGHPAIEAELVKAEVAKQVTEALAKTSLRPMQYYTYAHEGTLFPKLPDGASVNIEKKYLQKIKTQRSASLGGPQLNPPWTTHKGVSSENGRLGASGSKLDAAASKREGGIVLKSGMVEPSVAVNAVKPKKPSAPPSPVKETIEASSSPARETVEASTSSVTQTVEAEKMTNAAKRRERKKARQVVDTEAQVPLNSNPPATAGDPTTNGQPQFLSPESLRLLESRGVRL